MKLTPWEPDLQTIVARIDNDDIDLQPDFQRQEIWPPSKKKRLIDTILRGWSIPPVFLVVTSDGRMDVLDGQQRLAAIRDFIHNRFAIDGKITPHDDKIATLHGKTYKRLGETDKRFMDQYTLRCFRITDYAPDEPSELFYRLNQPSMLTAGEQRNAFYGPAREQLKDLVQQFESGGNDKQTIGFSNARLAYDDIIARVLFFLEAKTFAIKGTEALISQRFKGRNSFSHQVMEDARKSIVLFSVSRNDAGPVRLNKASVLSWLLFFARFNDVSPIPGFMSFFYGTPKVLAAPRFIPEAHAVFHDRASLRVTDVSSVIYRDFSLWYIYFTGVPIPSVPSTVKAATIEEIHKALESRRVETFEQVLAAKLDLDEWGRLP